MNSLTITQATDRVENVTSEFIDKLYSIAIGGGTIVLEGNLKTHTVHQKPYDYLNNKTNFPNLYLAADYIYLNFDDPLWETFLANRAGDGTGVTLARMRALAPNSDFISVNSSITIQDLRWCDFSSFNSYRWVSAPYVYIGKINSLNTGTVQGGHNHFKKLVAHTSGSMQIYGWNSNPFLTIEIYAVRNITSMMPIDSDGLIRGNNVEIEKFYIGNTTPPQTVSSINKCTQIFVPTDSVSAYQTADVWSTVASRIQGYDFENDPDGVFAEIDEAWNLDGTPKV